MKKLTVFVLAMVTVFALAGCGNDHKYKIGITVPAGNTEAFVYSDAEIAATGKRITIYAGEGCGDAKVILHPVDQMITPGYVAVYLTPGTPVEFDAEKGVWFKIGVSIQNNTDTDKTVYVEAEGVEVKIQ